MRIIVQKSARNNNYVNQKLKPYEKLYINITYLQNEI